MCFNPTKNRRHARNRVSNPQAVVVYEYSAIQVHHKEHGEHIMIGAHGHVRAQDHVDLQEAVKVINGRPNSRDPGDTSSYEDYEGMAVVVVVIAGPWTKGH